MYDSFFRGFIFILLYFFNVSKATLALCRAVFLCVVTGSFRTKEGGIQNKVPIFKTGMTT